MPADVDCTKIAHHNYEQKSIWEKLSLKYNLRADWLSQDDQLEEQWSYSGIYVRMNLNLSSVVEDCPCNQW